VPVSALAAVICVAIAAGLLPKGAPPAPDRLARLLSAATEATVAPARVRSTGGAEPRSPRDRRDMLARRGAAGLAGIACAVLLGGFLGVVVGIGLAVAVARLLARLEPRATRQRRARLVADLPIATDLLAACLLGGSSWAESVDAVATALGGPVGTELHWVAARIRLGAEPATTWLALADEPELAALARTAARASASGSALASTLARLAEDQRRAARAAASARARAAGVRAVAPLGLCFLPAFVLIGIVPAIAGIASGILIP
jgi:Flp pilus assembly protein TadB